MDTNKVVLLRDIHKTYRRCSAVHNIQRYLRGFFARKYVLRLKSKSSQAATDIQSLLNDGYIFEQRMNDELKELLDEEDHHLLVSHHELQKVRVPSDFM